MARTIPLERRPVALRWIKGLHTAAFVAISGAIAVVVWDALRGRRGRRTAAAAIIAIGETAVYVSNDRVCPLTPLAEALGATSGTVTDLYLPRWVSDRVPLIGGSALLLGCAVHLVAWRGRERA